jgi:ABC-2 type transport system permease protein
LKAFLALFKKEYRLFFNDMVAVSLTFFVPIFLIFIFGSIFGGSSQPSGIHLGFINNSTAPIARKLERTLDTMKTFILIKTYTNEEGKKVKFDTTSLKEYIKKGSISSGLVIPEDAYTDTSFGLKLKFYYDPKNDLEMQLVQGMLQKTVMEQIPSIFNKSMQQQSKKYLGVNKANFFNKEIALVVSKYFNVDTADILHANLNDTLSFANDSSGNATKFFSDILQLQKEQLVGKEITNPWAARSVGGWAVMFLLFAVSGSATSLFDEKKSGVVLRILTSPVSRVHILWSKYIFNISLGIIQLFILFVAGSLLFKIDIFTNVFNLLLVILAGSAACTSFGMLLAAFSKTQAQASGWGTFLILGMSAIGGAWFPTFLMPSLFQTLAKGTFVYWTIDGFLNVLWRNCTFVEILPNLGILIGIAALLTTISIIQFKKGHVF